MKLFFLILIWYLFQFFNAFADVKFSDYKDYKMPKINFQLEEILKGLNYPWGMSFIDDENLLITEKNGRLLKVNISTGEHFEINLSQMAKAAFKSSTMEKNSNSLV